MPAGVKTADPTDRTGTIGVEAFDPAYGAGFQVSDDSPHAVECELVEDGGAFVAHRPTDADRPRRVAFVDGHPTHRGAADAHQPGSVSICPVIQFNGYAGGLPGHPPRGGAVSICPQVSVAASGLSLRVGVPSR